MRIWKGEFEEKHLLLFAILTVAFGLRMFTWRFPYLLAFDPYHHYRIAEHIAGTGEFPLFWPISSYPQGSIISEPMGLYYVSILFNWILRPFGTNLMQSFRLVTPIVGVFLLVPLYLFAREVGGERSALLSAAILAFLPAFIFRTSSGFYRGDAFALFFLVSGFLFFLKGLEGGIKVALPYLVFSGCSFGAMALVWQGFVFGFVVLSAFVVSYSVVEYVCGRSAIRAILGYSVSAGICVTVVKYSILLQPTSYATFFVRDLSLLYAGSLVFPLLLELLGRIVKNNRLLSIGLIGAVCAILAFSFSPEIINRFSTGYGLVKAVNPVTQSIRELQPVTLEDLFGQCSLLFPLSLFGVIIIAKRAFKRVRAGELLLFVWALSGIYLILNATRFLFIASVPLAVSGGLFLEALERYIKGTDLRRKEILARGAVLLLIVPIAASGAGFANELKPHLSEDWYSALKFLEGQEEGAVLCWWDYGSWVQGITGFPTTLDTVHGQNIGQMKIVANMLLQKNQSKTLETLDSYHVRYVVMPSEMVFQMHNLNSILNVTPSIPDYIFFEHVGIADIDGVKTDVYGKSTDKRFLVSHTDEGKVLTYLEDRDPYSVRKVYYWEGEGLLMRDYSGSNYPVVEGEVFLTQEQAVYISPRIAGTLLNSLTLLNGYGFDAYEPIFANPEVRIYEVQYNHTWVEGSIDKSVYTPGDVIELRVGIDSTTPFEGRLEIDLYNRTGSLWLQEDYGAITEREKTFRIPLNESFTPERYNLYARLRDPENKIVDTLWRPFWIR